jgi:hypothetical protein
MKQPRSPARHLRTGKERKGKKRKKTTTFLTLIVLHCALATKNNISIESPLAARSTASCLPHLILFLLPSTGALHRIARSEFYLPPFSPGAKHGLDSCLAPPFMAGLGLPGKKKKSARRDHAHRNRLQYLH